jgi:hypothetical protein
MQSASLLTTNTAVAVFLSILLPPMSSLEGQSALPLISNANHGQHFEPNLQLGQSLRLRLDDFTVTTDSVVATAKVRYSGTARRVTVRWGDGTESRKRPTIPGLPTGPEDTFQHVYAAPVNGYPFTQFVTASVESLTGAVDVEILSITITPRYEVIQYTARFRPLSNCDSLLFQSTAEFVITQYVAGIVHKTWTFDDPLASITPSPVFRRLDGSTFRREFLATDAAFSVQYNVDETDPGEDHDLGAAWTPISIALVSSPVTHHFRTYNFVVPDCDAEIRYDIEMNLLKPNLSFEHLLPTQSH